MQIFKKQTSSKPLVNPESKSDFSWGLVGNVATVKHCMKARAYKLFSETQSFQTLIFHCKA